MVDGVGRARRPRAPRWGVVAQLGDGGRADAEHRHAQLGDDAPQLVGEGLLALDRRAQEGARPGRPRPPRGRCTWRRRARCAGRRRRSAGRRGSRGGTPRRCRPWGCPTPGRSRPPGASPGRTSGGAPPGSTRCRPRPPRRCRRRRPRRGRARGSRRCPSRPPSPPPARRPRRPPRRSGRSARRSAACPRAGAPPGAGWRAAPARRRRSCPRPAGSARGRPARGAARRPGWPAAGRPGASSRTRNDSASAGVVERGPLRADAHRDAPRLAPRGRGGG